MHGFWGRLLHIDLSSGHSEHRPIDEARLRKYLGGVGLGTSLLYEYAPAGVAGLIIAGLLAAIMLLTPAVALATPESFLGLPRERPRL